MREHTWVECNCNTPGCMFCDGGLGACTVCGGFEGTLTTECCGRQLTSEEEDRIYKQGNLDFKNGQWVNNPNYEKFSKKGEKTMCSTALAQEAKQQLETEMQQKGQALAQTQKHELSAEEAKELARQKAMNLFNPTGEVPQIDKLPRIEIVHAAQMFKMPGNNVVKEFTGVILEAYPCNAYWEKSFEETGGGELPDCSSFDGIKPNDPAKAASNTCATCALNQFGSDPKGGKGKACKNMRRLFILIEGYGLPLQLTCPPTSLKSFSPYVTDLRALSWPYQAGNAKFSLQKVDTYSVLKIELESIETNMDKLEARVKIRDEFMEIMHKQEITMSDYSQEGGE